jgi:hypothetical protein
MEIGVRGFRELRVDGLEFEEFRVESCGLRVEKL